ncbi:MAG: MBL fold metallo-hydrolase [Bacillota bacterium]
MIIKTLVENTSVSKEFKKEHGLSLFIKSDKHKILFDLGASNLVLENADKLSVDLKEIDTIIVSHAHYDHTGGLEEVLDLNSRAKIYIRKESFKNYYSNRDGKMVYIGMKKSLLDKAIIENQRFIITRDHHIVDEELELYSNLEAKNYLPVGNKLLFRKDNDFLILDDFKHEQYLIIKEGSKNILLTGCAHKGIVNIIEEFIKLKKVSPDYVIGGFHLLKEPLQSNEGQRRVKAIANYLKEVGAKYYTCHCTGNKAYKIIKEILGNRIEYLSTGSQIEI